MQRLGIAVIGTGNIADFHLKAIQDVEQARLVCIYGRSVEKAKQKAELYGCEWSDDLNAVLSREDVQLVSIVTSSGSHYSLAKQALEAGKHIFVEKPLTMLPQEADELIALAERQGLVLSVISQRRFEKPIQAVKVALDNGDLGELLLIEARTPFFRTQAYYDSAPWRGTYAEDGGALMNQGIHQIDLLLWFGGQVKSVFGRTATQTHKMEAEDLGLAIVTFENGALGYIMSSTSIQPGFPGAVNVYGSKGTVHIEGGDITLWHVPGVDEPQQIGQATGGSGASDPLAISYENHKRQYDDVLQAIAESKRPLVTGADGALAVRVINSIYETSRTGKEIVY